MPKAKFVHFSSLSVCCSRMQSDRPASYLPADPKHPNQNICYILWLIKMLFVS